jgi:glycosyltransferase involved in cell wall biosynthesis
VRIVAATCAYPPYRGGIGSAAARQAAALAECGHEVTVLCPHMGEASRDDWDGPVRVRRLRALARHGVSAIVPSIAGHVARADALMLHYPFYGGAEAAVLAARTRRVPYAVFFHMDVPAGGLRGAVVRAYDRTIAPLILRGAHALIVSSRDYAESAVPGRLGMTAMVEIPYGIDTRAFRPGPVDPEILLSLGLRPDVPIVLFVGGMDAGHAFKGVPVLIDAMARLPAGSGRLVLVGDGELRAGFEARAREAGLDAVFAGGASDATLRALYRAGALTVLPSVTREEAFGIVLIESMASGTPVVASDLPGVRTVVDEATGRLVPARDPAALAATIASLLSEPGVLATMRVAARNRAVARFSRERERADLAAVIDALPRRR